MAHAQVTPEKLIETATMLRKAAEEARHPGYAERFVAAAAELEAEASRLSQQPYYALARAHS